MEHLLSVGLVAFGILRLSADDPIYVVNPYIDDLRSETLCNTNKFGARFVRFTLVMTLLVYPSFKGQIAAVCLLASMLFDYYQYPPPQNSEEISFRASREMLMELITFAILMKLIYAPAPEYTRFVIFKILAGIHMFWIGYFGKLDFDEVLWFSGGYPRHVRIGEPDLDQLNRVSCPEYRYRIIQWIGFALMADERLIYCFSFCVCSFLTKYAITRHRVSLARHPEVYSDLNALL